MKKILLSLVAVLMFAGILHAAGTSSPISGGPSWDNVRKVVRFMTSDGNEITVDQTPKQYVICVGAAADSTCTYNGVAAKVTGTASWSVVRGVLIPYRTADGAWRMRFNIIGNTSGGTTSVTLTFNGVTFKSTSGFYQPYVVQTDTTVPYLGSGGVTPGTSTAVVYGPASASFRMSGDVELDGKPTWMD